MLHRSPGIAAIYNEVKHKEKIHILDLGSLSASCFEFFSSISCKIYFESLNDFVIENASLPEADLVRRIENYLLSHDSNEYFDVVLCWDLLSYMPLEAVSVLLTRIRSYCKPHTLIHSIRYLGRNIPQSPARFILKSEKNIDIRFDGLAERRFKNYSEEEFLAKAPDFTFCDRVKNRKGMLRGIGEDVLRCSPSAEVTALPLSKNAVSQQILNGTKPKPIVPFSGSDFSSFNIEHNPKFVSPVMKKMLSELGGRGLSVLDLGERNPINSRIWRGLFKKVHFDNLYSSMKWNKGFDQQGRARGEGISDQALCFGDAKFDLIVMWDIFNFCSAEQIASVFKHLNKHCHKQTKLVAFNYSGNLIPNKPQKFFLTADGDLHIPEKKKFPRLSPSLSSTAIMKLSEVWTIKHTYIYKAGMKSGVSEFLFEYMPTPTVGRVLPFDKAAARNAKPENAKPENAKPEFADS